MHLPLKEAPSVRTELCTIDHTVLFLPSSPHLSLSLSLPIFSLKPQFSKLSTFFFFLSPASLLLLLPPSSSSPPPPSPPLPLLWAIRIHYSLSWFMAQSHIVGEHGGMPINLWLHTAEFTHTPKYTACICTLTHTHTHLYMYISKTWINEHSAWSRAWTWTHTHTH